MKRIIKLIIAFWLMCGVAQAQQYFIRLDDASGMNTDPLQPQLEAAAKELVLGLPETLRDSFKVFDLGCYLHQSVTNQGYKGFFEEAKAIARVQSKYFLIIGKKCGVDGVFTDFEVDLELPTWGRFACTDNSVPNWRIDLSQLIENKIIDKVKSTTWDKAYIYTLKETLIRIKNFTCSDPMGDLKGGLEYYLGDGSRSRNNDEYTMTTTDGYYYRLKFKKDVSSISSNDNTLISYDGKEYMCLFDHKTSALGGFYLADANFFASLINADGTYSSQSLKGLTTLDNNEFEVLGWGIYNKQSKDIKDVMFSKDAVQHNRSKVFQLFDLINQLPDSDALKGITFSNINNPCNKMGLESKDFKDISEPCLDFIISELSNQLANATATKGQFLKWLDAPKIDVSQEKTYFDLLKDDNIFYTFSAQERLRALFYIASYDDQTVPSLKDISDYLEKKANKLLQNTPKAQIQPLLDALEAWPNTVTLNDPSVKIQSGLSILFALNDGIDDSHAPFAGGDNFTEFAEAIVRLIENMPNIETKIIDYKNHKEERNLFWNVPQQKEFVGYRQATTTTLGNLLTFGIESWYMGLDCVIQGKADYQNCKETFRFKAEGTLKLKPFDLIAYWKPSSWLDAHVCLLETGKVCAIEDKQFEIIPAFLVHYFLTKKATEETTKKIHIGINVAIIAASLGVTAPEIVAEEYIYSTLALRTLILPSALGHITIDFRELNGLETYECFKDLVSLMDIILVAELGWNVSVFTGNKIYIGSNKLANFNANSILHIKAFVNRTWESVAYLEAEIAVSTIDAAIKARLYAMLEQAKGLAGFFGRYIVQVKDNAAWLNRLKANTTLKGAYLSQLTATEKTLFQATFQYESAAVLGAMNTYPAIVAKWASLLPDAKAVFIKNIDILVTEQKAIASLKLGKYEDAVAAVGGKLLPAYNYKGYNYIVGIGEDFKSLVVDKAITIAENTQDIGIIAGHLAAKLNMPLSRATEIVATVKKHFFIDEHLVQVAPGVFKYGRFERYFVQQGIDPWNNALTGTISDDFVFFLAHEYTEAKLMQSGMSYQGMGQSAFINGIPEPSAFVNGAHYFSPLDHNGLFAIWQDKLKLSFTPILKPNLSNMDEIIVNIKKINGL